MRAAGPTIEVTRWYTSKGAGGRKILVIACDELPIFADHSSAEEDPAKSKSRKQKTAKKRLALTSKIDRLWEVFFFMDEADHSITIVARPGADPEQVESAIRRVIARHHQWMISRPKPDTEEEFWRPTR